MSTISLDPYEGPEVVIGNGPGSDTDQEWIDEEGITIDPIDEKPENVKNCHNQQREKVDRRTVVILFMFVFSNLSAFLMVAIYRLFFMVEKDISYDVRVQMQEKFQ